MNCDKKTRQSRSQFIKQYPLYNFTNLYVDAYDCPFVTLYLNEDAYFLSNFMKYLHNVPPSMTFFYLYNDAYVLSGMTSHFYNDPRVVLFMISFMYNNATIFPFPTVYLNNGA